MRLATLLVLLPLTLSAAESKFEKGFPTEDAIKESQKNETFQTAVTAYRFWYPTVSFEGNFFGLKEQGIGGNEGAFMKADPKGLFFTANADTPYLGAGLNLKDGPMVIEMPEGPYMGIVDDHHQRWVVDLGLPGKEAGKAAKHLILPPDYKGDVPSGYQVSTAQSYNVMLGVRAIPQKGDADAALESLKKVKVYPLSSIKNPTYMKLTNLTGKTFDFSALRWEDNFQYWVHLKKVIDEEPLVENYRPMYGLLAELGIEKGKPFKPNSEMKELLEKAAKEGRDQMLIAGFADNRPERMVWKDRKWEWATLVYENGDFRTNAGFDLHAKDKWFSQAIGSSPAMFRRSEGAGSLYWLGLKDNKGKYLDGGKTYKLTVPGPVPAKLFWSISVYDNATRCFIQTEQNRAAIRSLFELKDMKTASYDLYFGPKAPAGKESQWIKTIPGKGWFTYFRIYGPTKDAFNGKWKPGDFEEVDTSRMIQAEEEHPSTN